MPHREGITAGYWGDTGTGKTFAAMRDSYHHAGECRAAILIIDGFGARNFDALRDRIGVWDAAGALDAVVRKRRHAIWQPGSVEELDAGFFAALDAALLRGAIPPVILLDEINPWMSAHYMPPNFTRMLRAHRHRGVSFFLTSQYIGDVAPPLINCINRHFIFRNQSPRAVQRITDSVPGIDARAVQTMPDRSCIVYDKLNLRQQPAPAPARAALPSPAQPLPAPENPGSQVALDNPAKQA